MRKIVYLLLSLPLLLSACKDGTEVENPSSGPITLLGSIGSIGVETRGDGVIDGSYATALPVNFARIDQSATDGTYSLYSAASALDATRVAGSGNQSINFAATQSYLSSATYGSTKMVGWYPRAALSSGVATYTLDGSTDVMLTNEVTGSSAAPFSNAAQAFTFAHQLTQVQVKVYAENSRAISDWGTITSIKVKSQSPTCTVTLPSTVAFSGTAADLSAAGVTLPLTLPSGSAAAVSSGYAIIPPVAANAVLQLQVVTSNGGTKTVTLPTTTALAKSNAYVYTLKFTQTSISVVGAAQVGAWLTPSLNNYEVDASTGTVNLSAAETANSYIARPGGTYKFKATVRGNGETTAGITPTAITLPASPSVSVVWQSSANLISGATVSPTDGYVTFSTNAAAEGNAVIAVKDGNTTLWSWHIWVANYNPNVTTYTFNGNVFMDRNLGATTAVAAIPLVGTTLGLSYQWGRKDPFPNSSSPTASSEPTLYDGSNNSTYTVVKEAVSLANNLDNSTANPGKFYTGTDWYSNNGTKNDNLWGTTAKTIYDPCPPGWRVPAFSGSTSPWNGFTVATGGTWNSGYTFSSSYFPANGYRDAGTGNINAVGTGGSLWSATVSGASGYRLNFSSSNYVDPLYTNTRGYGFGVRCVKK